MIKKIYLDHNIFDRKATPSPFNIGNLSTYLASWLPISRFFESTPMKNFDFLGKKSTQNNGASDSTL